MVFEVDNNSFRLLWDAHKQNACVVYFMSAATNPSKDHSLAFILTIDNFIENQINLKASPKRILSMASIITWPSFLSDVLDHEFSYSSIRLILVHI